LFSPDRFSKTRRRSKRRPSGCCSVISRTISFGGTDNLRTYRVHPPLEHILRISTAPLSSRRDDWIPEQPKSCNGRGSPSRYRIELELTARPSASTLSSVNTSPFACGSIRTVKLFGCVSPANVDRATSIFQVPNAAISSATVRMWIQCRRDTGNTSPDGFDRGVHPLHLGENKRYSRTNGDNAGFGLEMPSVAVEDQAAREVAPGRRHGHPVRAEAEVSCAAIQAFSRSQAISPPKSSGTEPSGLGDIAVPRDGDPPGKTAGMRRWTEYCAHRQGVVQ